MKQIHHTRGRLQSFEEPLYKEPQMTICPICSATVNMADSETVNMATALEENLKKLLKVYMPWQSEYRMIKGNDKETVEFANFGEDVQRLCNLSAKWKQNAQFLKLCCKELNSKFHPFKWKLQNVEYELNLNISNDEENMIGERLESNEGRSKEKKWSDDELENFSEEEVLEKCLTMSEILHYINKIKIEKVLETIRMILLTHALEKMIKN